MAIIPATATNNLVVNTKATFSSSLSQFAPPPLFAVVRGNRRASGERERESRLLTGQVSQRGTESGRIFAPFEAQLKGGGGERERIVR